jgi:hypothetical protein
MGRAYPRATSFWRKSCVFCPWTTQRRPRTGAERTSLQEPRVLTFQFALELDAQSASVLGLKSLGGLQICAIDLDVVGAFAGSIGTGVERLTMVAVSVFDYASPELSRQSKIGS